MGNNLQQMTKVNEGLCLYKSFGPQVVTIKLRNKTFIVLQFIPNQTTLLQQYRKLSYNDQL